MKKIVTLIFTAATMISVPAMAQNSAAATARANVVAVKAAAVQVIQTKGAKDAVEALKTAVASVKTDVQAVRADTNASKSEIVAAYYEAAQTKATLAFLKSIATAAKKPTGN